MNYATLFKNEYVQVALDRYKFNTVEDMYAAVGFGAISSSRIIAKILEAYKKDNQDEEIEKTIEELVSITGLTASNIKVKLHRIRKKLFVLLNGMDHE